MTRPRYTPPPSRSPIAPLPRWLRPKLNASTQRELSLAQHVNIDAIASGTASVTLMHEWADGVLMFSRIAETLQRGVPEMRVQLELTERVATRCAATGRVEFADQAELEIARDGLVVFDLLVAECDDKTGMDAAAWSARMRDRIEATRQGLAQ